MILIDLSNLAVSNFIVMSNEYKDEYTIDQFRGMVLNSIRKVVRQFSSKYGDGGVYICLDSKSWRYYAFPQYKANRKKSRSKDEYDWDWYKASLLQLAEEFAQHIPFNILKSRGAEADDLIGTAVDKYSSEYPIMIVSRDGDFCQLHRKGVRQYDPVSESYVECENAQYHLKEKLLRGDTGDGIPNFLSPDDIFLQEGVRQKSVFAKQVVEWLDKEPEHFCTPETLKNYRRNELLIDLKKIPVKIRDEIVMKFDSEASRTLPTLNDARSYFIKNRLVNLLEQLHDFDLPKTRVL